jgi:hypothetical protein
MKVVDWTDSWHSDEGSLDADEMESMVIANAPGD